MDPAPPPLKSAALELPGLPPVALWRSILWSVFIVTVIAPVVGLTGVMLADVALDFSSHSHSAAVYSSVFIAVPSLLVLAIVVPVVRLGLRRNWPARRGQLIGWGVGAAVMAVFLAVGANAFTKVRESSKLKSMLPRQPAAAIDQFFLENPYRIFVQYNEIVGFDKYVKVYNATDGEDLRVQFPVRRGWMEPLSVRLPNGTTVQRLEVLAAIGQSGLIVTYPLPQDDKYDPKRVYRLDCGVSFRNWHVVNLPPDPAGREGRDQDGVHTYRFPDGRRFEITYRGGVPDGPFRAYHADGAPWGEATYRNGHVVEAWLIARDGRKYDELKDGEAANKAVENSLAIASLGDRESGLQNLRAKDYDGAIADLTRALATNPFDKDLHRARSEAYRATDKLDAAIDDYGTAEGFSPEQLGDYRMPEHLRELVFERGRRRQQAGDTAGANRDFAAIGKDAGWAAEEMLRNRDLAGAIRMLDSAIAATPVAELYAARAEARRMLPGQLSAAEADYTQAIELARQGKMQVSANQRVLPAHWLYKRGHVRRLLGNLAGAAEDFRAARPGLGNLAVIQQTDAAFWLFLVQCEQGRKTDATAELARTDQSGWMEWNRQYARFLLGESTEAQLDEYAASNRNNDILFRVSFFNAMLRRFAGDNTGALIRFQQAFKHSTYDDFARDETRRALIQAARSAGEQKLQAGDFTGAIAEFNKAAFLGGPGDVDLLVLLADAKRGLGDLEGALSNYQYALRKISAEAHAPLRQPLEGKITALERELEPIRKAKAAASINTASRRQLKPAPAASHPAANPGLLKFRAGDYEGAIADFTSALRLRPQTWYNQYSRGHARRLNHDLPGASEDFRAVIEANLGSTPTNAASVAFWLYFTECEQGQTKEAAEELEQNFARIEKVCPVMTGLIDINGWNRQVAEMLLGHITLEQLLARIDSVIPSLRPECRRKACFFGAMMRRLANDEPGSLDYFRQVLASPGSTAHEFDFAEAERALAAASKPGG